MQESSAHRSTTGNLQVRTVALDSLVTRREIRPPDFIKIEFEGAEYDCLKGCEDTIRNFHPVISLATHGQDMQDQALDDAHSGCLVQFVADALSNVRHRPHLIANKHSLVHCDDIGGRICDSPALPEYSYDKAPIMARHNHLRTWSMRNSFLCQNEWLTFG